VLRQRAGQRLRVPASACACRPAPARAGQRLGLRPAGPGDQGTDRQQAEREPGTLVDDEQVGRGRAHQQADQPERGQAGQSREQQADGAGELQRADQVPLPLPGTDLGEQVHHLLGAAELERPGGCELQCQQGLERPQVTVRARRLVIAGAAGGWLVMLSLMLSSSKLGVIEVPSAVRAPWRPISLLAGRPRRDRSAVA